MKALLEAPRNLKHRAMLATMYGAGLRVSEVAKLKVSDLDRERRVIWVRGGKGHKDRQVMLAEPLREVLVAYWKWKRPTEWLFPGKRRIVPIATGSVFKLCEAAAKKAGIAKPVHPHSLATLSRHICWTKR
ncbi:MAG TPA: tyrosine-type recombinase/integrase [Bryobacteraceae bacterium]